MSRRFGYTGLGKREQIVSGGSDPRQLKDPSVEVNLREMLGIVRRRGWIVLLIMVIAGAGTFVWSSRQEKQYAASARVVVLAGQGLATAGNEYSAVLASKGLAETYRVLIETGPVFDRVIDELDLPYDSVELDKKVTTSVVGETQVIEVSVTDTSPEQAARIATGIVEEFPLYIQDEVDSRIAAQVEVADPAQVPTAPFAPRVQLMTLLGAVLGLLGGVGLIALLEFMDNTVKPDVDFQELAHAPVLATVANLTKLHPGGGQVYSITQPRSSAAESLRLLRTNLEFAAASGDIRRLVITSPGPGDGKSTVAANLGVVMAQAGLTTVVIDADLRKPTQHRVFSVSNEQGLTTMLAHPDKTWRTVAKNVLTPGLWLIPSGPLPPNPYELLNSPRFVALLESIGESVDLVIVDTPPVLSASEALAMARHTDGIVMVCRSNATRRDSLHAAASSVHHGGIRLIGVVLNRLKGQQGASYYGQYYGSQDETVGRVTTGD